MAGVAWTPAGILARLISIERRLVSRVRARNVFAMVADRVADVQDDEKNRNEGEAPHASQIETVQAHEA